MKNLYALIVGINNYKYLESIHGCDNDASSIFNHLLKTGNSYNNKNILTLEDENATAEAIGDALSDIVTKADKGDYIFFYFSGRGTHIPGIEDNVKEEALCPYDFNRQNQTWLSCGFFSDIFDNLKNGTNLIAILDTGYAISTTNMFAISKSTQSNVTDRTVVIELAEAFENTAGSSKVFSACSKWQTAAVAMFINEYKSVFTYFLLEAKKKYPNISDDDLLDEVAFQLKAYCFPQKPTLEIGGVV